MAVMGEQITGFRVEASGSDIALNWLRTTETATSLPVQILEDQEPMLPLGRIEIRNSLLESVYSGLSYLRGAQYQFRTHFIFRQNRPANSGVISELLVLPRRQSLEESVGQVLENILGMGANAKPAEHPVSLQLLTQTIQERERFPSYKFEFNSDIDAVMQPIDSNPEYSIIAPVVPSLGPIYSFENIRAKIPTDPEEFARKYEFYARIVEEVVLSLYQASEKNSPNTILNFAPPDNTTDSIRQLEKKLSFTKKQLNAAGYIEDGYDEDIERGIVLDRPVTRFVDVGGQEKAKTELSDVVAGLENPYEFYSEGAEPPNGVLLYGPSGTGKTLLARATAGEAEAKIFAVGLASILHSLFGKTERYIQRIFDKAREEAPAIIFFDEIDAIARQRNHLNAAYSSIINTLLTNMDGMRERTDNVVVLGATNMLELVDDALLRPGRFDLLIPVELPDETGRAQVLEIHRRMAIERALRRGVTAEIFEPDFDLEKLVKKTQGFSGADLAEILRRALVERVRLKRRGINPGLLSAANVIYQIDQYEQVRKDKLKKLGNLGILASVKRSTS